MKIKIPVKPHTKHLLGEEYGREPIFFRANNELGRILLPAFSKTAIVGLESFDVETEAELADKSMTTVEIQLGFSYNRLSLTPDRLLQIGSSLDALFRIQLYYFVKGRRALYDSELAAVKCFLKLYNINEDLLKEETAIKMCQRFREKIKK